jgi:hypothetical protein
MIQADMFFDNERIIKKANESLAMPPVHITDRIAEMSEGDAHEYYSNGDYWWPDPKKPDGLPYIRRDGESNPDNFNFHRNCLRQMRTAVANLAAGYKISGREEYAAHAVKLLKEFFLDEKTYMAPHLKYAQAIPGVSSGRGIGIIDTIHLIEIPFAINVLQKSSAMSEEILYGLKEWFRKYLDWMNTHPYGISERDYKNNHAIGWHAQALSFAGFVGNGDIIRECAERYKKVLLPKQMRSDGGFEDELKRTKPYSYSNFVLDNAVTLVHLASMFGEDLWSYETEDGRSIKRGLDFLLPYLEDKSKWFLPDDVEHFDSWPARASFMVFAGIHYQDERYLKLYRSLPHESSDEEVRRNLAIRQPILLLI